MQAQPTAIPYGYCHCRCGQKTTVSDTTNTRDGWVKGQPKKYVSGHGSRTKVYTPYVEEDRGYLTPCWVWRARIRDKSGYGCLTVDGRTHSAHRVYYERANGPIVAGLHLDHLCRVPLCVNPDHLEPVTCAENVRRGAATKLTRDQVREIYRRVHNGELQIALATEFGVCPSLISRIKLKKAWVGVL